MASASYGERPAYIAWKLNSFWVRGSLRYCSTLGASLRNPPIAASRARLGVSRSNGESMLRSMKSRISYW